MGHQPDLFFVFARTMPREAPPQEDNSSRQSRIRCWPVSSLFSGRCGLAPARKTKTDTIGPAMRSAFHNPKRATTRRVGGEQAMKPPASG